MLSAFWAAGFAIIAILIAEKRKATVFGRAWASVDHRAIADRILDRAMLLGGEGGVANPTSKRPAAIQVFMGRTPLKESPLSLKADLVVRPSKKSGTPCRSANSSQLQVMD